MQLLTEIDNYITNNTYPVWYKYSDKCSGINPPTNSRPITSTKKFIDEISECIKNNKYPTYYKYTSCSGVITPDMPATSSDNTTLYDVTSSDNTTPSDITTTPINIAIVNNGPKLNGINPDIVSRPGSDVEIYYAPHEISTYESPAEDKYINQNIKTDDTMDIIDRVEYSSYSNNSSKDKIINMIKKVYRYNDDKYKQACKYVLDKFSYENSTDSIAGLNKLLDEKNIYNSSEFVYNPILRLTYVKNIDNILNVDDMRKIFTILY
jgi:hypothetical protein